MNKNIEILKYRVISLESSVNVLEKMHKILMDISQSNKNLTEFDNLNLDLDDIFNIVTSIKNSIVIMFASLFDKKDSNYPTVSLITEFPDEDWANKIKDNVFVQKIIKERNKLTAHFEENGMDNMNETYLFYEQSFRDNLSAIKSKLYK